MSWALFEAYLTAHPDEAVALIEQLPAEQVGDALDSGPVAAARAMLSHMDAASAAAASRHCSAERLGALLVGLAPEASLRLLRRLPRNECEQILEAIPDPGRVAGLRRGLAWPAGSAGALMNPQVLSLPEELTVREARRSVRRHAAQAADDLWVTSRDGELVGALRLRELILGDGRDPISRILDANVGRISASVSRAALASHPQWSSRSSLPVVDERGRLIGAVARSAVDEIRSAGWATAPAGPVAASLALGELYWVTAAGLFGTLLGSRSGRDEGR